MAPPGTGSAGGRPSNRGRKRKERSVGSTAPPAGSIFSKVGRFAALCAHRRRNVAKERGSKRRCTTAGLVVAGAAAQVDKPCGGMLIFSRNNQPTEDKKDRKQDSWEWTQMKFDTGNSWRNSDAKFCCICGDAEDQHVELVCPYNYMSPATYIPCRARLAVWNDEMNSIDCKYCKREKPSRQDDIISRRRKFLRCFVRVNNLSECCRPEQFVRLFTEFGPLWMYHLAMHSSEICGGFGYVVFEHREHAEEAVKRLNCCNADGRKLRVDWAYPNA
ncbi:unnamed protein product [Urochloa humidicola]